MVKRIGSESTKGEERGENAKGAKNVLKIMYRACFRCAYEVGSRVLGLGEPGDGSVWRREKRSLVTAWILGLMSTVAQIG